MYAFPRRVLCHVVGIGLLWWLGLPRILVALYARPEPTTCDLGWWGCEQDALDRSLTETVVIAPMATSLASHVFTFVACPVVSLRTLRSATYAPELVNQDLVIFGTAQLFTLGANNIAKDGFLRQRPCYYYGRSDETEAGAIETYSSQEWKSFWSGDTSMAWSFIAAAVALLHLRGRKADARRLALAGGALAAVGSLLRIIGFMHWLTDVLAGAVCGCLCGASVPILLLRVGGATCDLTKVVDNDETLSDSVPLTS